MKRVTALIAAILFFGGMASAQPRRGLEGTADYLTYKSTNIATTGGRVSFGAYLYKIIVSSPAAVTGSGGSTVTFYNANGSASNPVFSINTATNVMTGVNQFNVGVYFSSGIYTTHLTTGVAGSVQAIYMPNAVPSGERVWSSTFTPVDGSTQAIAAGPVLLHKVIVLDKGTGTSFLEIHNNRSTSTVANQVAQIDLTSIKEDGYTFDIMLSSGLVITGGQGSGSAPGVLLLYKRNPPRDWEYWSPYFVTGTLTNTLVQYGRGVFGGVVVGSTDATGQLTVYDSSGSATTKIADIDTAGTTTKRMYDVNVSSGVTVTNVGTGLSTILYRRLK